MTSDGGNRYEYANGVLRNTLNIRDAGELERVEATVTALRIAQLDERPIAGAFDLDYLKSVHRHIFQDLYDWAGELRETDISKDGARFAHFAFIESNARILFAELANEDQLRGLPLPQFAARAAYYLGEMNALHPFREGNGRSQRTFLSLLAREAGYTLRWDRISVERMTRASVLSLFQASNTEFEQILLDALFADQ